VLIGRESECAAVERVVQGARDGRSGALLVLGEPGVGKTALLAHAVAAADGLRVVRATGIESEAELEYSGLLELVRPLLDLTERLAAPQAEALRVALGLGAGAAPDRFVVGAATLSLLATAAEKSPLLVVVDDGQWLDRSSSDAIRFAARRLFADRVGFLFAARPAGFEGAGMEELRLTGLDSGSVAALAAASDGGQLSDRDAAALAEATAGNPLAVIELVRAGATPDAAAPGPVAVTETIERAFAGRLAGLPEPSRRALCVAAAAASTASAAAALETLGLTVGDLTPAEDAGLVVLTSEAVAFAHPLLRSVAHQARPVSERRAAHAALAEALDEPGDAERRAWHLASAAVGPDETAAAALVAAAESARARGGQVAAARALERAARLTGDPGARRSRLAEAAHAAWDAGDAERAAALVDAALAAETDPAKRARLTGLVGRIEFQAGDLERAHRLLLDSAETLAEHGDREQAVTLMGVATLILHTLARVEAAVAHGRRALAIAASASEDVRMRATYHLARSLQIAGRADEAEPLLEAVVAHLLAPAEPSRFALQRSAIALAVLDRADAALPLARRTLEAAQATGPMQVVYALSLVAQIEMYLGDWRSATATASEGRALADDMGQENIATTFASFLVRIAGARGDGEALRRFEPGARIAAEASGNRFELLQLDHAIGMLALAEDRLGEAVDRLEPVAVEAEELGVLDRDLAAEPDLVEALLRLGRAEDAAEWLDRWVLRGAAGARAWAPPLVARCSGLLADDDDALTAAVEGARALGDPYSAARSVLIRGESRRRRGQRRQARTDLRAAVEAFERLGADTWAERGRRELRASGAKLRRAAEAGAELTPQELQVALQVAEGKANKEVAAALFLSPKTVEFHLSRIYRKLGIGSRAELVVRMTAARM
jgi:DNA-binding CsgD family transcriptional regulator